MALMLALARAVPAADAAMKQGVWDKKRLTGAELRGKTLGVVGLGRIGQEVAARARGVRHGCSSRTIRSSPNRSRRARHRALLSARRVVCARPTTSDAAPAGDAGDPAPVRCASAWRSASPGRIVNTARGELIDEAALADAIESGQVGGAGLDVFETEPPETGAGDAAAGGRHAAHRGVDRRGAGTGRHRDREPTVRDFLCGRRHPQRRQLSRLAGRDVQRLRPFITLAERMGAVVAQLATGRTHGVGIRYYGPLVSTRSISGERRGRRRAAADALLRVTIVNARSVAVQRGIEIIESRSSRPRDFANLLSVKLQTSEGERWVEGTVFEPGSPRLTLVDGVELEAPLEGTVIVITTTISPASSARSARSSAGTASTSPTSRSDAAPAARWAWSSRCEPATMGLRRALEEMRGRGDPERRARQGLAGRRRALSFWRFRVDGFTRRRVVATRRCRASFNSTASAPMASTR